MTAEEAIKTITELPWTMTGQQLTALEKAIESLSVEINEWEHIWDAPDGTYRGRCKQCGFTKIFVEGHDTQYRFCPCCGGRMIKR